MNVLAQAKARGSARRGSSFPLLFLMAAKKGEKRERKGSGSGTDGFVPLLVWTPLYMTIPGKEEKRRESREVVRPVGAGRGELLREHQEAEDDEKPILSGESFFY